MKGPLIVTDDASTDPRNPHEQTPLLDSKANGDSEDTFVDDESDYVDEYDRQPVQPAWRVRDWWFNRPLFRSRWHLFEVADLTLSVFSHAMLYPAGLHFASFPPFLRRRCQAMLTALWTHRLPLIQRQMPAQIAADLIIQVSPCASESQSTRVLPASSEDI